MPIEMESPGITFTVQWRKKSGTVSRQEDVTSIGLWDPDDSTLDWQTFKSYVCQNLGTMDDISVAYVDSSGDELPIESECEFREALKFARQRAHTGRETVLKVDRQHSVVSCAPSVVLPGHVKQKDVKTSLPSCPKQKNKIGVKTSYKSNMKGKSNTHCSSSISLEEKKINKDISCKFIADKFESCNMEHTDLFLTIIDKLEKLNLEQTDGPPQWFRRYMQKFKSEIVAEVTSNVLQEIQHAVRSQTDYEVRNSNSWVLNKNKSKKKLSDEESSDGALGNESRDHKLLKKIEKLHKREKKLEKKLDSKLEKLENKTKRMMEKRSQCKARCEKMPDRKIYSVKRRSGELYFGTYLMDAILLNDGPNSEIVIKPGEHFTKVWEIMNAGTLPWTDKTELRQGWGTSGLEPEETVVECPILQPGETGTITMKFRAPDFPGKFKSYWHFYHMGDRFGHWLGCAVVVKDHLCNGNIQNDFTACSDNKSDNGDMSQQFESESIQEIEVPPITQRDHFESDFESDNLSVISAPGSYTFNSEDENFVVIPMPACFVRDVPLGHAETIPVLVKSDRAELKNSDINYLEEAAEENESCEKVNNSILNDEINDEPEQFEALEDRSSKKVYAVDPSGCCIVFKYSNHLSPNSSVKANHHSGISVPSNISDDGSTCNIRSTSSEREEFSASSSGHMGNTNTGTDPPISDNVHSDILSGCNSPSNARSLGRQDPLTNIIHILPAPLVSGAVSVASSAFSTARAVFSNLRGNQQGDGSEWQWGEGEIPPADKTTAENLELLVEMGFQNRILNVLLLQKYCNDINKVIAELLSQQ